MRFSIRAKIIGTSILSLIISCSIVFLTTMYLMTQAVRVEMDTRLKNTQRMIDEINATTLKNIAQIGTALTERTDLQDKVLAKDYAALYPFSQKIMSEAQMDFITITDAEGIVLTRAHSQQHGDSIVNQYTVASAIKGIPASGIVVGSTVSFSLRASIPIKQGEVIIGTLSLGRNLSEPAYVDWIKGLSATEVTIFKGDTRVMTTIKNAQGQRVAGTKMETPIVLETVLKAGNALFTNNRILGTEYSSAYWPIKDDKGTIAGMWFIGMPMDVLLEGERKAMQAAFLVSLAVLAIMLAFSSLVGHAIAKPIKRITFYAQKVASGHRDDVLVITNKDEVGDLAVALNIMVDSLKVSLAEASMQSDLAKSKTEEAMAALNEAENATKLAKQAKRMGMLDAASQLADVVGVASAASDQLTIQISRSEQGAVEQSRRMLDTAGAMDIMGATVNEVAITAQEASLVSASTREEAQTGAKVVQSAVEGIQQVQQQAIQLKADMNNLHKNAQAINEIMQVISDIADQTNLLALNAAIEAARAGEAGRGFAVVADEVRKLAEKTMASTTDVAKAVKSIQTAADHSMQQVENSVSSIELATHFANASGEALQRIVEMADITETKVRGIVRASEEQLSTNQGIHAAIAKVSAIGEDTAHTMQDALQAVAELARQTHNLSALIKKMQDE